MNAWSIAAVCAATLMVFQPAWAHTDEQLHTMPSPQLQLNRYSASSLVLLNISLLVKLPELDAYGARVTPLKPKTVRAGRKTAEGHDHDLQHQHH